MTLPSQLTPTPSEVLKWDLSGLPGLATDATALGDTILKAAQTMHDAIYDLNWSGAAKNSADGRADRELATMRALTSAYDLLADYCTKAHNEMEPTLTDIKTIFTHYAVSPVTIHDDWSITGVTDWNSEAGQQLSRIAGLWSTLHYADLLWGMRLDHAHFLIATVGSDNALKNEVSEIKKIKSDDPNAIPDSIATNPTSFWAPDIPGTTASSIVGAMAEGTRIGLEKSGNASGDASILKWVENWGKWGREGKWTGDITSGMSRFGVAGGILGTVPSIADDIHGGMNPTEAIVSEGGGTAGGMLLGGILGGATSGALEGGAIGSVVPGIGNVTGFVVGAGVGALSSYGISKGIQWLWK